MDSELKVRRTESTDRRSVSIALATFNGERFLSEQLDSFARQTRLPDELIVQDDGSTDSTVAICERFGREAPFPVVVKRNVANVGLVRNFEKALQGCTGDYVFLSDQDDVWYDTKIETMVAALEARPDMCLAIHDLRYCDRDLGTTGQTKLARVQAYGWTGEHYVTGMATVVRQSLLDCALPIPDSSIHTHDDWLHQCAVALGGKLVMDVVLADYRRHDTNATSNDFLNAVHQNAWLERLRFSIRPTVVEELRMKGLRHTAVRSWLGARRSEVVTSGLASAEQVDRQVVHHETYAQATEARLALLRRSRAQRFLPVALTYLRGGYLPFRGLSSALKDLLQRRTT